MKRRMFLIVAGLSGAALTAFAALPRSGSVSSTEPCCCPCCESCEQCPVECCVCADGECVCASCADCCREGDREAPCAEECTEAAPTGDCAGAASPCCK